MSVPAATTCKVQLIQYHVHTCRLSQQLSALTEEAGRAPGGQDGPPEDMSGLVDGIMHQLLAKDVLYQPIQDIGAKYPEWLETHRYSLSLCTVPSIIGRLRKVK